MIMKEAKKILKYKDLVIEIQRMWNVKMKVILALIGATAAISKSLRLPEQHAGKARNKGTAKNSHIEHFTHTAGSADVKIQNIQHRK